MSTENLERKYMERAIELAKKAVGYTSPNPLVGAVIVKDGEIIGEGYHERCGQLHAERNAIKALTKEAKGATIYVTLEPCCHYGKTPPCTEAIIENQIGTVVIGSRDPNPLVAGKGAEQLRKAGIRVIEDFMREECDQINPIFFHYITNKTPYVAMKYAMTMDGKIATRTGASKWITGESAREHVQTLRHKYKGIMVGIGTLLADDPMLNCRMEGGVDPIRIVCDTKFRIPVERKVVETANEIPAIVATTKAARESNEKKANCLEQSGVQLVYVNEKNGHIDLSELMHKLGEMGIDSILLEGGGTLNDSMIQDNLVQCAYVYVAPKIFGGKDAKSPVEGIGVEVPSESVDFDVVDCQKIGQDILLRYRRKR